MKHWAQIWEETDIPADLLEQCKKMRSELLEELATIDEANEEFMTKVLENPDSLTEEEIHAVDPQRAFAQTRFNPVLCGTAFKNKGVQQLLDAVVDWMPSPLDRGMIKGHQYSTRMKRSISTPA